MLGYEKWSSELKSKPLTIEEEACVSHETIYQRILELKKVKFDPTQNISTSTRTIGMRVGDKNEETQRIREELSKGE